MVGSALAYVNLHSAGVTERAAQKIPAWFGFLFSLDGTGSGDLGFHFRRNSCRPRGWLGRLTMPPRHSNPQSKNDRCSAAVQQRS
jgi:hypothetical protein